MSYSSRFDGFVEGLRNNTLTTCDASRMVRCTLLGLVWLAGPLAEFVKLPIACSCCTLCLPPDLQTGADEFEAFAAALAKNTSLTTLNISCMWECWLSNTCTLPLMSAPKLQIARRSMKHELLGARSKRSPQVANYWPRPECDTNSHHGAHFALHSRENAMVSPPAKQFIHCTGNRLGFRGIRSLAGALQTNTTLTSLDVHGMLWRRVQVGTVLSGVNSTPSLWQHFKKSVVTECVSEGLCDG